MPLLERVKHQLIGTPLQAPAEALRWALGAPKRRRHPELREIYREADRVKDLMRRSIRDGMNSVDIGCHLGSVLEFMTRLSPSGRHVAVEPVPHKARWLAAKYPRVRVHQCALSDREGRLEFLVDPKRSGTSRLETGLGAGDGGGLTKLSVDCRRLDDLIPADHPVHFIKLDVEGAELGVLRGAGRILANDRPILLFECTRLGLDNFGVTAAEVFHELGGRGYRIWLIRDRLEGGPPIELAAFESSMAYPFQAFNYVAATDDAAPRGVPRP